MSTDVWFFVNDLGQIIKRTENDGWAFLRHGPEAEDEVVTEDYVKQKYPAYYEHHLKQKLGP